MNFDISELIKSKLNLEKAHVQNNELWALCINPEHKDRNPTNFSINLNTGKVFCFACGFSGNIVTILHNRGLSYDEAFAIWNHISDYQEFTPIPDYQLDPYLVDAYRNLGHSSEALRRTDNNRELLDKYNIFTDREDNTVFLLQDARKFYKAIWVKTNGKYLLIEPITSKAFGAIFGEHLPPTEYTVLVEGFFDALKIHNATGLKTVCCNGTKLSAAQIIKLKTMAPLIIFPDFDTAGRLARDEWHNHFYDVESYYCGGPYKDKDPDDLTNEEIRKVIAAKVSWLDYLLRYKK